MMRVVTQSVAALFFTQEYSFGNRVISDRSRRGFEVYARSVYRARVRTLDYCVERKNIYITKSMCII